MKSVGTFIPNDEAKPFVGQSNTLEKVLEYRLEVICDIDKVRNVLKKCEKYILMKKQEQILFR